MSDNDLLWIIVIQMSFLIALEMMAWKMRR